MIKDTMKRKKPSFNESYYGYRTFTDLLEEADNLALVDIERNPRSGTYVVKGFGEREAPKLPSEGKGARGLASPGRASTRPGRGIASRRPRSLDAARKPGVSGPPTDGRPMVDHLPRCRGPERISRREMLQVGGAGLLGLSLPGLLRAEAEAREGAPGSRRGPTPASSSSSTAGRATSTCGT